MPELRFPSAAAWQEFKLDTALITPTTLKLKIKPSFRKDLAQGILSKIASKNLKDGDFYPFFADSAAQALKLVEDWDLMQDGVVVPCTPENKEKYLSALLWEAVVQDDQPEPDDSGAETIELGEAEEVKAKRPPLPWLFLSVLTFAGKSENYLKN